MLIKQFASLHSLGLSAVGPSSTAPHMEFEAFSAVKQAGLFRSTGPCLGERPDSPPFIHSQKGR